VTAGTEYDRNLRTTEKPLGLRVRVEAGTEVSYPRTGVPGRAGIVVNMMPGFWWMPLQNVYRANRFVLAIEPRIGVRVPVEDGTKLGPYGDLSIVTEWDWVPCTIFGGGSCKPHSPDG
jgi:hypothetical protein